MSQPATRTKYQPESHAQNPHFTGVQTHENLTLEVQSPEEKVEEARRIRRLQLMMHMVMQVIQQDRSMPVEQASEMVADARRAALAMFPDKALAFDLIFWPRLQRLMRERYRMQ